MNLFSRLAVFSAGGNPESFKDVAANAAKVNEQLDLFWITEGGGNGVEYLSAHPDWYISYHVKDHVWGDRPNEADFEDVGPGMLDFPDLFDAGYDSERNHRVARQCCHLRSVIPPLVGRPAKDPTRPPGGRWRRLMRRYRDCRYGQRWQAETTISMIKRRQGGYVLGRTDAARSREMMLKVLTHNVMINAETTRTKCTNRWNQWFVRAASTVTGRCVRSWTALKIAKATTGCVITFAT